MKLVVALERPERLDSIQDALNKCGINQMTVSKAAGNGKERRWTLIYRSTVLHETFIPKLRLEIAVEDSSVEAAIEAIKSQAKTDQAGDGVIFVLPLEKFVQIRSSECDRFLSNQNALPVSNGHMKKASSFVRQLVS
jgi:nitrogen regulatory protein P-II 2